MIEPDLSLQKPLEDYVEYIEKLNLRSIPLLMELCDPSLSFQDPYHNVKGVVDTGYLLERRFKTFPNSRYKVHDFMWGRRIATAYLFWSFHYKPEKRLMSKGASVSHILEGMSEIKFSPDGRVFSHSEFWGAHEDFNVKSYKKPD